MSTIGRHCLNSSQARMPAGGACHLRGGPGPAESRFLPCHQDVLDRLRAGPYYVTKMSAAQNRKNRILTNPFTVKKAALTRERSCAFTKLCS